MTSTASPAAPNTILLQAGMGVMLIALFLAWTLVFSRALPIGLVTEVFADYDRLLQAHLDFLIMGALLLGYYAARVPLPASVRNCMAIGVYTNPAGFLYLAIWPDAINTPFMVFSIVSFVITTYGFGLATLIILRSTLRPRTAAGQAVGGSAAQSA